MDANQFWNLIDESRRGINLDHREGNMDRQVAALTTLLSPLSADEVLEFRELRNELMVQAYTWELWGAAYLLGGGACSDDMFTYFRSWLISMGRRVFESAVANPDSLAAVVFDSSIEDFFFEDFWSSPNNVLEEKTGEIPKSRVKRPPAPSGKQWREESDDLKEMLPKLWRQVQRKAEQSA